MKYLLLLLLLCGCVQRRHPIQGFLTSDLWEQPRWQRLPVSVYVDPSITAERQAQMKKAIDSWKVFTFTTSESNANVTIREYKDFDFRGNELARTTLYWEDELLLKAVIRINIKDNKDKQVHLESLVLHELGHALGLNHEAEDETVMNPLLLSHEIKNQLTQHEISRIEAGYGIRISE